MGRVILTLRARDHGELQASLSLPAFSVPVALASAGKS